ncbi:hypothetical protein GCM10010176_100320 [Nonomuraea spiralis]|nr:hypothetical protein GCM10010176_100320 [Nonomuraea spiralis]
MRGVERADRELLDAAALFPDEQFADLFPSGKGRPSMPASVAASILTLQTLLDLSDADTTDTAVIKPKPSQPHPTDHRAPGPPTDLGLSRPMKR